MNSVPPAEPTTGQRLYQDWLAANPGKTGFGPNPMVDYNATQQPQIPRTMDTGGMLPPSPNPLQRQATPAVPATPATAPNPAQRSAPPPATNTSLPNNGFGPYPTAPVPSPTTGGTGSSSSSPLQPGINDGTTPTSEAWLQPRSPQNSEPWLYGNPSPRANVTQALMRRYSPDWWF